MASKTLMFSNKWCFLNKIFQSEIHLQAFFYVYMHLHSENRDPHKIHNALIIIALMGNFMKYK